MRLTGIYHIFPQLYWKKHVCNKFERMQYFGLFDAGIDLHITIIQPNQEDVEWLKESCDEFSEKITIYPINENFVEYEAIRLTKELGDQNDGYTMYIHTKGCSRNSSDDPRIHDWDEMMSFFIVDNWEKCVEKLEEYNCVGCNFVNGQSKHFSGNFWWAKNSYIKKLPIPEKSGFRWAYEFWIGYHAQMNPFCPFKSPVNHYDLRCTSDMYQNIDWKTNYLK